MGYISELRKLVGTRPVIMSGVAVLVFNDKQELLLQRRADSGDWGTIGGGMELGESFEEAAHRELYEESGLTCKEVILKAVLSGKDMYYRYPNGDEVYNAIMLYEAIGVEGEPFLNDDEGLELKFFSLTEPIDNMNQASYMILSKSGCIQW